MHAQGDSAATYDNPQAFRQALLRTSDSLSFGNTSTAGSELPSTWQVKTADGSFSVSAAPARNLLERRDVEGARQWLRDLAQQVGTTSVSAPESDDAASKLHAILARREFAKRAPPSALERLQERFNEWLRSWLGRLFVGSLLHPSAWQFAFWAAVVVAVALLASFAYRLWSRPVTYLKNLRDTTGDLVERPWQEWSAAAKLAAEREDYRRAVQCAYWAGVAKLQDGGNLPGDLTHTPREYLRLLSVGHGFESLAAAREALRSLTFSLERFWYGRSAATDSDYHACLKSLEALGCQVH